MTNLLRVSQVIPIIAGNMKEWDYKFDPVSKEDWIRQIENDLRQKPFSSLQSAWWPGEPLTPLVHADDIGEEIIRLPDHFFTQPPIITEYIDATGIEPELVNQKIHEALQFGAQAIILRTDGSNGISDAAWFQNVIKEIVSLSVELENPDPDALKIFAEGNHDAVLCRIIRSEDSLPFHELIEVLLTDKRRLDSLRFLYHFPSSGNWDIPTANTINGLLNDLDQWRNAGLDPDAFLNQCILSIEADKFYFKHILQSRVLYLLWQNLKSSLGVDFAPDRGYLECHIKQTSGEFPDHFLIRASMSALAASLSGTHWLCVQAASLPDSQSFYRRINRNIHHLLNLESGIYKGKDPLSGAFAIDYHCRNWTIKIWDMLSLVK